MYGDGILLMFLFFYFKYPPELAIVFVTFGFETYCEN
jgi:hypothetical protein